MTLKHSKKPDLTHKRQSDDYTRLLTSDDTSRKAKKIKSGKKTGYKWTWMITLSLFGVALISSVFMLCYRSDEKLSSGGYENVPTLPPPLPVEHTEADDEASDLSEPEEEISEETLEETPDSLDTLSQDLSEDSGNDAKLRTDDDHIYSMTDVSQVPVFPGGDQAMYAWLRANNQFIDDETAHGKVVVSFIVEKTGNISDVRIVRGRNAKLDSEAVRLVSNMPAWQPGNNDGTSVRVKYQFPITF